MIKQVGLFLVFFLVISCNNDPEISKDTVYKIFPIQSSIIGKSVSPESIKDFYKQDKFTGLSNSKFGKKVFHNFKALDSLNSVLNSSILNNPLWFAAVVQAKELDLVFVSQQIVEDIVKDKFQSYSYESNTVFFRSNVYWIQIEDFIVFSASKILLEQTIRQFSEEHNLMDNSNFTSIINTDSSSDFQLFVNFENLEEFKNDILRLPFASTKYGWSNISFQLQKEKITYQGAMMKMDTISNSSTVSDNEFIVKTATLPSKFSFFTISKGFPNNDSNLKFDTESTSKWYNNKFGRGTYNNSPISIYQTLGEEETLIEMAASIEQIETSSNTHVLHRLIHPSENSTYIYIHSNWMFESNDSSALMQIAHQIGNFDLLDKYASFKSLMEQLPENNDEFYLLKNPESNNFFLSTIGLDEKTNSSFQFIAQSTSNKEKMSVIQGVIPLVDETNKPIELKWKLDLKKGALGVPQKIFNHQSKEYEIVYQDEKYDLHIVTAKGKNRLTIPLSEKLLSPIRQVDMFKNNKYQMVFNTASAIHLYDKNGKKVGPYPISFASTLPISVFEYKKNEYRIFAIKNNTIKLFDARGRSIPGFQFSTSKKITAPPSMNKLGNDVYLFFHDEQSSYILSRVGKKLHTINDANTHSPLLVYNNKLIYLNSKGKVNSLSKKYKTTSLAHMYSSKGKLSILKNHITFYGNGQLKILNGTSLEKRNIIGDEKSSHFFDNGIMIGNVNLNKTYIYDSNGTAYNGSPITGGVAGIVEDLEQDNSTEIVVISNNKEILCYEM